MQPLKTLLILTSLVGTASQLAAQDRAAIEKRLAAEYTVTRVTAEKSEILSAGSILVLQKDNLMMVAASNPNPYQNTYKNGKITQNAIGKLVGWGTKFGGQVMDGDRVYVAGEKMWLTKMDVNADSVSFELLTDAINDVRYRATLKFPFPKGTNPSADQVATQIAGVLKVQQFADTNNEVQQPAAQKLVSQQQFVATRPSESFAPIAPPLMEPPPPTPKTLSLGQSKEEVVAVMDQPTKIAKLGPKEIYYYKDLKIIFVAGKVSDVQ